MKLKLIIISTIFFSFSSALPQYSKADSELVRTTFTREFCRKIIEGYLGSKDSRKVKAALLSIAQSEDTLWVPQIIKLNFNKYCPEICFALGELGPCIQSSLFLFDRIKEMNNPALDHEALNAIGKTGDINSINEIINSYKISGGKNTSGISLAMYGYFVREIAGKNEVLPVLINELKIHKNPGRDIFETAFALYRTSAPDSIKNMLIEELKTLLMPKYINNYYAGAAAPYLLGCIRKLSYFPDDSNSFDKLIATNNYALKAEAARSLIYYKYSTKFELDKYLSLLNDENRNIGRTAASSLKSINLNSELKAYLKSEIIKRMNKSKPGPVNQDELFLSYLKLFPDSFENQKNNFKHLVTKNCFYDACGEFGSSEPALNFLLNSYNKEDNKSRMNILQSLLNFQEKFRSSKQLSDIILGAINSDFAPLIAISSDGIDSTMIKERQETLKTVIPSQIKKYMNNPDYQESIISLTNLSAKTDSVLYNSILNILANSDDYSIKKYCYKQLGKPVNGLTKSAEYFHMLWPYSFKYRSAEILTGNGKFTINFLPQFAPISAGNFEYLAAKKFFNNNSFHRVVPSFVIQGGDPEETGWGGPGYDIVSEYSNLEYSAGMLGMASAGKDTEGSQWFVTTGIYPHLNGRYTIFGKVTKGLNVVNRVEQNDKIISIKLN